jgi:hypothetical protein
VLTVNRRARALYERLGLTEVASHAPRSPCGPVGPDNPVMIADLVSCAGRGMIRLDIWLRAGLIVGHFRNSCRYDSPTWRCCACSAGLPCSPARTGAPPRCRR